jgi:GINS complex subunit 2
MQGGQVRTGGECCSSTGPQLAEFAASGTLVKINPKFELKEPLHFINGKFGPFRPSREAEVPLWLALDLKRRGMCEIYPPDWLDASYLKQKRDQENDMKNEFGRLPFHYLEVGKLLLNSSTDYLGKNEAQCDEIRMLLRDIDTRREEKIREGLPTVKSYVPGIKLNNLTAIEIHSTRPILSALFDTLRFLSIRPAEDSQDMTTQQTQITFATDSQQMSQADIIPSSSNVIGDTSTSFDDTPLSLSVPPQTVLLSSQSAAQTAAIPSSVVPSPPPTAQQVIAPTKKRRTLRDI